MIPNRLSDSSTGFAPTLEVLVARVSRGDEAAFAALYEKLSSRVFGLVRHLLRDDAQSEEVTQEIFVEAWQNASRYDPSRASVTTWLMTIAHRRAVDRIRSSQASRLRDLKVGIENFQEAYEPVEASAILHDESHRVMNALRELSEEQRLVIQLAYFGGLTHVEVAEHLQLPLGTVKTRIRDGMQKLRSLMGAA